MQRGGDDRWDSPVTASGTVVGEHDWGATYGNRWGSKFAYVTKSLDAEVAYAYGNGDFGGAAGATDFGSVEKTFHYKLAYAHPNIPVEVGVFGSVGTVPVSTGNGIDSYNSQALYVEIDPSPHYRPGCSSSVKTSTTAILASARSPAIP